MSPFSFRNNNNKKETKGKSIFGLYHGEPLQRMVKE
jgi:hypothetical protein